MRTSPSTHRNSQVSFLPYSPLTRLAIEVMYDCRLQKVLAPLCQHRHAVKRRKAGSRVSGHPRSDCDRLSACRNRIRTWYRVSRVTDHESRSRVISEPLGPYADLFWLQLGRSCLLRPLFRLVAYTHGQTTQVCHTVRPNSSPSCRPPIDPRARLVALYTSQWYPPGALHQRRRCACARGVLAV